MIPNVSMRGALSDRNLLGSILEGESWHAWRVLLIAAMGEPLLEDERQTFTMLTGRAQEPGERVEELAAVVGRRGGKSRAVATLASYLGGLCDHSRDLAPGEKGVVLCIAPDQRQSRIVLDYSEACFEASAVMRGQIAHRNSECLELSSGISIEVRSASFRRLRGLTLVAAIADEAAFWHSGDDSANADTEILGAVRPGLATTGGPLVIASSPYAKRGELWSVFRKHYGPNGDPRILVAQAPSRVLNPRLPQTVVDRALERDRDSARAEYLAQFRADIESYIAVEIVEKCVDLEVYERPPLRGVRYVGFVDPSGGSVDSFTMAIAHRDGERVVVDVTRERRPPFSPEGVVAEFGETLKAYGVSRVRGDRYAGEWPREAFRKRGIVYEPATAPKSDLYRDLLPMLNGATIALLDNARLVNQIAGLERRVSRAGKDSIDHSPGGHDDVANAVAGVAWVASGHGAPQGSAGSKIQTAGWY